MTNCNAMDKASLALELAQSSFAQHEAVLYLDTHPTDAAALEFYCKKQQKAREARAAYESAIGPLTADNVDAANGWTWSLAPWPWQY